MGQIRVLSDQIANKIAAGEVVERPAAVVKELVENALDAGARSIRIEVEGGGRKRIRITDDGAGMVRDDALLAFERHATSKLRDVDDLEAIATLGFRGEALPSIAAVSRLTLETAARAEGAGAQAPGESENSPSPPSPTPGTRVEIVAGVLRQVGEVGLPAGTAITVEDLFLNVPARKKFLRSESTELGHIATLVTNYALAYPELRFQLDTPQRNLLLAPPVAGYRERLAQLLGAELLDQLLEVRDAALWPREPDDEEPRGGAETAGPLAATPAPALAAVDAATAGLGLSGFISRPELQKLNRNSIYLFVNRRLVRDRLLQHAITEAYRNLLPTGAYPVVLLFLDLPYGEVDVNVHPSKTEVRFRRQNFVHDAVRDSLRRALGTARPLPSFPREIGARANASAHWSVAGGAWSSSAERAPSSADAAGWGIGAEELSPGFRLTPELTDPSPQRLPFEAEEVGATERPWRTMATPAGDEPAYVPEAGAGCEPLVELPPHSVADAQELAELSLLGQVRDSFIVAAGLTGLWLIDQHAAHERVLFEQVMARMGVEGSSDDAAAGGERPLEGQRLLLPMLMELDPGRWARFAEIAAELRQAGFEAEAFGARTLAVQAVPAGIPAERVQAVLEELLEVAEAEERACTLERVRTRIAATIACHAAIKVNMHLEDEKMRWLLQALAETAYPMTCPHGRPVALRYSLHEIQRAFKRVR